MHEPQTKRRGPRLQQFDLHLQLVQGAFSQHVPQHPTLPRGPLSFAMWGDNASSSVVDDDAGSIMAEGGGTKLNPVD
jgi:hypothetical protein